METKPKTYLVTGGAGFIGSSFVELLKTKGHRTVVLDALTYAGHRANLDNLQGSGEVHFIQGQIQDGELVGRLLREFQPDAVVNFAAESHVDRSIEGPAVFIETNILGTYQLLEQSLSYWRSLKEQSATAEAAAASSDASSAAQSKHQNFRYLQISTDEVYGSLGETGKFSETTSYQPNSPYSASKAGADHLVRAWHHTFGLPTLTTNCSNNYGPRQFPEKLIPLMIHNALAGKALPVYGTGKNVRDWIHVEDHCAGIFLGLEKGTPGSTYCFGGNAEMRNLDVVQGICSLLDELRPLSGGKKYEEQIEFVQDRAGHDWRYAIDDTLAQKELGFTRRHNFASGLRSTLEWYLNNTEWVAEVLKRDKE